MTHLIAISPVMTSPVSIGASPSSFTIIVGVTTPVRGEPVPVRGEPFGFAQESLVEPPTPLPFDELSDTPRVGGAIASLDERSIIGQGERLRSVVSPYPFVVSPYPFVVSLCPFMVSLSNHRRPALRPAQGKRPEPDVSGGLTAISKTR